MVHARIAWSWGSASEEPLPSCAIVLGQRYRGSRLLLLATRLPERGRFTPPARLLGAERIGLSMDESDQLEPKQSTTPWWPLHSQARLLMPEKQSAGGSAG